MLAYVIRRVLQSLLVLLIVGLAAFSMFRFARARGLKECAVDFRHALKNMLVPVITVTGLQLGSIIAFAIDPRLRADRAGAH